MTSMNSKLLNFLRDELFIYTNCYGCDTIYIYHMARAFMAFADTCDIHNLKIRSNDLVFCVCSCRTTCHRVRDVCRWYWNDKVSLLEVLLICTVTYKPIKHKVMYTTYIITNFLQLRSWLVGNRWIWFGLQLVSDGIWFFRSDCYCNNLKYWCILRNSKGEVIF